MTALDETVIELSKTKLRKLVLGGLVFIVASAWMVQLDEAEIAAHDLFKNPMLMHGLGWAGLLFFGLCSAVGLKLMLSNKPGLILSQAGIQDNTSYPSAGFVPWSDIADISVYEIYKQQILVIKVRDPERYICNGGVFKRMLKRINYKLCGSPVNIAATSLKLEFNELLALSNSYLKKYGGHR